MIENILNLLLLPNVISFCSTSDNSKALNVGKQIGKTFSLRLAGEFNLISSTSFSKLFVLYSGCLMFVSIFISCTGLTQSSHKKKSGFVDNCYSPSRTIDKSGLMQC
ncbi:hypothetical protein PVAND_003225 [Polypedilum vanderplanki]|uniref:Uncharacterized protein n=1 Tax=Polypedilum vanderplanki TaxID=319348 RepID=A0A9J6BUC7_POLVA|nr:hypothetical protein PVAND_003225 [Polypedilum vanderplanki]